jgi:hypothetical protein
MTQSCPRHWCKELIKLVSWDNVTVADEIVGSRMGNLFAELKRRHRGIRKGVHENAATDPPLPNDTGRGDGVRLGASGTANW